MEAGSVVIKVSGDFTEFDKELSKRVAMNPRTAGGPGGTTVTGANVSPGANAAMLGGPSPVAQMSRAMTPAGMGAHLISQSISTGGHGNISPHANIAQNPIAHQAGGLIPRFPASAGGGVNWGRMIGNAPMSAMFGGWELGTAYRESLIGQQRQDLAIGSLAQLKASAETAQGVHRGIFGGMIGGVMDLFGAGPGSVMQQYDRAAFREKMHDGSRADLRTMELDRISMRAAGSSNPIERLNAQRDLNLQKLSDQTKDMTKEAGEIGSKLRERRRVQTGTTYVGSGTSGTGGGGVMSVPVYGEEDVLQGGERAAAQQRLKVLNDNIALQQDRGAAIEKEAGLDAAEIHKGRALRSGGMRSQGRVAMLAAQGKVYEAGVEAIEDAGRLRTDALDFDDMGGRRASKQLTRDELDAHRLATEFENSQSTKLFLGSSRASEILLGGGRQVDATVAAMRAQADTNWWSRFRGMTAPGGLQKFVAGNKADELAIAVVQDQGNRAYAYGLASIDAQTEFNKTAAGGRPMFAAADRLDAMTSAAVRRESDPTIKKRLRDHGASEALMMKAEIDQFYNRAEGIEIEAGRSDLSGTETARREDLGMVLKKIDAVIRAIEGIDVGAKAQ